MGPPSKLITSVVTPFPDKVTFYRAGDENFNISGEEGETHLNP